jgi:hypothetical protein
VRRLIRPRRLSRPTRTPCPSSWQPSQERQPSWAPRVARSLPYTALTRFYGVYYPRFSRLWRPSARLAGSRAAAPAWGGRTGAPGVSNPSESLVCSLNAAQTAFRAPGAELDIHSRPPPRPPFPRPPRPASPSLSCGAVKADSRQPPRR